MRIKGAVEQVPLEARLFGCGLRTERPAIRKAYKNIEGLRRQMWASGADGQKQMNAVLTKEQRDQVQLGWGRGAN